MEVNEYMILRNAQISLSLSLSLTLSQTMLLSLSQLDLYGRVYFVYAFSLHILPFLTT